MSDSSLRARLREPAAWLVGFVILLLIPFTQGGYTVSQVTLALVYAIAILGLNLPVGFAGQISLGQGAFFGVGAYSTLILTTKAHLPLLTTIPIAGLICFALGYMFGLPARRLRGLYLALVTLAISVALPELVVKFTGLTGGAAGLAMGNLPSAWGGLSQIQYIYLLAAGVAFMLAIVARNLIRSDVGRVARAIRDREISALCTGIDVGTVKVRLLAWSAMYAGIAGALYAITIGFVSPESFPLMLSITLLAGCVVGGLESVPGAVLGGLFIVYVPVEAEKVSQALTSVTYGVVIILTLYLLPQGLASLPKRLWSLAHAASERAGIKRGEPAVEPAPMRSADGGTSADASVPADS